MNNYDYMPIKNNDKLKNGIQNIYHNCSF